MPKFSTEHEAEVARANLRDPKMATRRVCNQVPGRVIQRIAEAAQSWLLLRNIEQQFGDQDGCVGRDMRHAEQRLREAIAELPPPPDKL